MSWLGTFLGAKSGDSVAPLVAAHVNLLVYAAAFWMAFPLIPFLARELGADDVELGYLTTFYSTLQLVGGPVVGRIGDRFGPRSALILTQLGSVVSYAFLAVAASLPGLFASRFWGVIQHAMQAAQALVALHSSHKDRAAALGRLSLSYGMGMVIGGPIGGKLASLEAVGSTGVALLSSALCAATIPLTLTFIRNDSSYAAPEVPAGDGEADAHQARSTRETTTVGLGLSRLVNVLRVPGVAPLILFNVILGFGVSVFRSSISHFAAEPFNLQPKDMGMLHAFAGLINIFSNTILVPMLLLYIGEPVLLYISTAVVMASLACFSGVGSYGQLMLVVVPQGLALSPLYTVGTSMLTKRVGTDDSGSALGLSHATRALCGIIAPVATGYLIAWSTSEGQGRASAVYNVGVCSASIVGIAMATLVLLGRALPAAPKQTT